MKIYECRTIGIEDRLQGGDPWLGRGYLCRWRRIPCWRWKGSWVLPVFYVSSKHCRPTSSWLSLPCSFPSSHRTFSIWSVQPSRPYRNPPHQLHQQSENRSFLFFTLSGWCPLLSRSSTCPDMIFSVGSTLWSHLPVISWYLICSARQFLPSPYGF